MQRLTARFLLLFALVGTFIPLAQASTPAPPHACCIRKAHHCHEAASPESTQLVITATACCGHDCCRAATTSQWANPQPGITAFSVHNVDDRLADSPSRIPATQLSQSQSTRAPPQISIA
jgi:hypothetical protein